MEEINDKKSNKGLIVLAVVLAILLLAALGYIGYDLYRENNEAKQVDASTNQETPKTEELVEGNIFDLKEVEFNKDDLSKQLKVAFNGKNHDIKIKLVKKNEEEGEGYTKFSFEVYLDNNLIDTISAGNVDQLDSVELDDFDGFIYIIDSKYFAIVTPEIFMTGSKGYDMDFYNENSKVGDSINLKHAAQTLCRDEDCAHSVRYWGQDCDSKSNAKYEVTFDGEKINSEIIEKTGTMYGGGASYC